MNWKCMFLNQITYRSWDRAPSPARPATDRKAGSIRDKLVCHNPGPMGTKYSIRIPNWHCSDATPKVTTNPSTLYFMAIQEEVSKLLLLKQAIQLMKRPLERNFYSNIFLVPKKDKGQRPVISLKALNRFVYPEHCKMEGIHTLLGQGDWLIPLHLSPFQPLLSLTSIRWDLEACLGKSAP